jgi:integrase
MANKPVNTGRCWEDWAIPWINAKWGNRKNRTPKMYTNYFWRWLEYFKELEVTQPAALQREHVINYLEWRKTHGGKKKGGHRNTAIHEIKFLGQLMDEAVNRGYASTNPCRKLHLEKTPPAEKVPWSNDEVEKVLAAAEAQDRFGWMHAAFLMGRFQAVRLRQSAVPLSCVDFSRRLITYPNEVVKGRKGYGQPIDPEFFSVLQELVAHRQKLGKSTLCDIPGDREDPPSVQIRQFLDGLGLHHLVHHGLRATWITQAALSGIPESIAKRFVNHASTQVHEIYQKITASDMLPMLDGLALYRSKIRAGSVNQGENLLAG